jgi:hypothetical protein
MNIKQIFLIATIVLAIDIAIAILLVHYNIIQLTSATRLSGLFIPYGIILVPTIKKSSLIPLNTCILMTNGIIIASICILLSYVWVS